MRIVILSSVASLVVQYVSRLTHKQHDIIKKLLNIKCVFRFAIQLLSLTFLILSRIERYVIKIIYLSSCKEHIILMLKHTLNHKPNSMAELIIPCPTVKRVIQMSVFTP
jgi:hypothetical protein